MLFFFLRFNHTHEEIIVFEVKKRTIFNALLVYLAYFDNIPRKSFKLSDLILEHYHKGMHVKYSYI